MRPARADAMLFCSGCQELLKVLFRIYISPSVSGTDVARLGLCCVEEVFCGAIQHFSTEFVIFGEWFPCVRVACKVAMVNAKLIAVMHSGVKQHG